MLLKIMETKTSASLCLLITYMLLNTHVCMGTKPKRVAVAKDFNYGYISAKEIAIPVSVHRTHTVFFKVTSTTPVQKYDMKMMRDGVLQSNLVFMFWTDKYTGIYKATTQTLLFEKPDYVVQSV